MVRKLWCKQKNKIISEDEAARLDRAKPKRYTFFETKRVDGKRVPDKKRGRVSPYICYVDQAGGWLTTKEAIEAGDFELLKSRVEVEFAKLPLYIADFIAEFDGRPRADMPVSGHYEGLVHYLKERKKGKSAKRMTQPGAIAFINEAWLIYRKRNPPKKKKYLEAIDKQFEQQSSPKEPTIRSQRIFNRDISSVIRRLTVEGYDYDEIQVVLKHFNAAVTEKTVKGQMWCGNQKGKYGLSARLSDHELDQVMKIIGAANKSLTPEPKPKETHTKKTKKKKLRKS